MRCLRPGEVPPAAPPATVDAPAPRKAGAVLLDVRDLVRRFGATVAVDHVDLTVHEGEVLGLVGESGSGKTTLARAIAGLAPDGTGTLALRGAPLPPRLSRREADVRRRVQMVFQNPDASLNPSHRVRTVLRRALATLAVPGAGREPAALDDLLERTRVDRELLDRLPGRLSGGQKQRVSITRGFAGRPDLVICDEPVSALDVSVQAAVLELLAEQRDRTGTSYLFISHDLAVVGHLADRIAVMYRGAVVEEGPAADVLHGPSHPYTALLVEAATRPVGAAGGPGATAPPVGAGAPSPSSARPAGCRFADRCARRITGLCAEVPPPIREVGAGHRVRCHLEVAELPLGSPASPPGQVVLREGGQQFPGVRGGR
ncbi:ABC transporter ATP-binding protein [Streptomyces litmocidini]|uniref:ABC transporter ATP-binding protein n=1 Tax=Streptomyces litmocidini TaxID=67318 RepID=A0ABW7U5P0_9ACTN